MISACTHGTPPDNKFLSTTVSYNPPRNSGLGFHRDF